MHVNALMEFCERYNLDFAKKMLQHANTTSHGSKGPSPMSSGRRRSPSTPDVTREVNSEETWSTRQAIDVEAAGWLAESNRSDRSARSAPLSRTPVKPVHNHAASLKNTHDLSTLGFRSVSELHQAYDQENKKLQEDMKELQYEMDIQTTAYAVRDKDYNLQIEQLQHEVMALKSRAEADTAAHAEAVLFLNTQKSELAASTDAVRDSRSRQEQECKAHTARMSELEALLAAAYKEIEQLKLQLVNRMF